MEDFDPQKINWREDVLPRTTLKALRFLAKEKWLQESAWYLAGGTALALFAGHRQSQDLDFFTPQNTYDTDTLLKHFEQTDWETDLVRENTVYARLLKAKVSFIAYPFFIPKEEPVWYGTVRVLPPRDIAVMKIIAISQRGKKRDFVDLYWYAHHNEPLAEVLKRLPEQYPTVAHDYHHILKSLMFFEDAESDPMPELFFTVDWKMIKSYFKREVAVLTKELLDLP